MSTTAVASGNWSRVTAKSAATSSVPPPLPLTAAQERELEAELRRELAALERRLAREGQDDFAQSQGAARDAASATQGVSDVELRRDLVAAALTRLESGVYGTCSHCGDPIPFGRLLVMPEATHCLSCSGRS